ncbi:MAG: carbohydrate ABC transporter permease [Bifidobacteriaceae bacterium]|jgi:multiple sugar transport system permease protein|nr:carbohydrate ABC transporter permease [Bifidobacteriaceae bacterium]
MRARTKADPEQRTLISPAERARPGTRAVLRAVITGIVAFLALVCAGPAIWLAKAAVSTTQDTVKDPLSWWPSGIQWSNLADAWNKIKIGEYTVNTVLMAGGTVIACLLVALTGGFAVAVLKPRIGRAVNAAVLATLFIPSVVTLVPLYLTVIDLGLINTYWAVWFPTAASAFNFLIVKQFAESVPDELFQAARIDGAGPFRLFWNIFLPMAKPIIGVLGLLSFTGAWKDFLWPLLALPSPDLQPLSVALTKVARTADQSLLLAGMFITVLIPVTLFLLFQKQFLRSAGAAGALKG